MWGMWRQKRILQQRDLRQGVQREAWRMVQRGVPAEVPEEALQEALQ